MANWTYQCGRDGCRKRYTFRKALENYKRLPPALTREGLCGQCGGMLHETRKHLDAWNKRFGTCDCGVPQFPHRRGSRQCKHWDGWDPWGLSGSSLGPTEDAPF